MGYEEDWLNVDVLVEVVYNVGFQEVYKVVLEVVIFDLENGVFIEIGFECFVQFGFWYKMIFWDFFVYEELELMDILIDLVMEDKIKVLNFVWIMVMQLKGILFFLK